MRRLTVGVSDSPHVTHPSTSNCEILYLDILYLLNCLLSALFDRQAVRISRHALPLVYQTFDQITRYNGDEKDVRRESQDQSPFEHRTKNYQLRDAPHGLPMMSTRTMPSPMPFPTSATLIGVTVSAQCKSGSRSLFFQAENLHYGEEVEICIDSIGQVKS
jgi:hypothetical protein